jgi:hypothetical protein
MFEINLTRQINIAVCAILIHVNSRVFLKRPS